MSDARVLRSRVRVMRRVDVAPIDLPLLDPQIESNGTALVPHVVEESRTAGYEAGLTAGHADGFARGYEEGLDAAAHELETLRATVDAERAEQQRTIDQALHAISQAAQRVGPAGTDLFEHVERSLATAAVELAAAIVGRELRDEATRGPDALARVLGLVPDRVPAVVRMHPADAAVVREAGDRSTTVEVIDDPTLTPGDAVATFDESTIDARIDHALQRARDVLTGGPA